MKVISIGTDRKIFEENSAVRRRQIEYSQFFDEVYIVVATKNTKDQKDLPDKVQISDNTFVYSTHSTSRLLFFKDVWKIVRSIIKSNSNKDFIISTQDPFETGLAGVFLKLCFDLPLYVQIHTDLAHKYFRQSSFLNKTRFFIAEFVLKYSDRVRVVSERIKKSIETFSKNIDVLPIKAEINTQIPQEIKKPFPFTLIMVCRLEKEKNIETVLNVIKNLKNKDIGLCLVGDGSERFSLEKMAKNMGISDKINFVGWQNNLASYYQMADAFISASLYEGYGVSTVEAAYFGKPLILSETGVARELFKDGESALICDAKDCTQFAKNILKIYQDKNLKERMGDSAKLEAEKHLSLGTNYFKEYTESILKTASNFKKRNFISRMFNFKKTIFNSFVFLRYFVCGLIVATVNITLLYVFTDIARVWYLYSSMLAFSLSLIVSFALHKFIVFRDNGIYKIHHQFLKFFVVAIFGVITNTAVVLMCVEIFGFWYIFSQIVAGFFVMIQSFTLYNFFIFNK